MSNDSLSPKVNDLCQAQYEQVLKMYQKGNFKEMVSFFHQNQSCISEEFKLKGLKSTQIKLASIMTEAYLFLRDERSMKAQFKQLLRMDPTLDAFPEVSKKPKLIHLRKEWRIVVFSGGMKAGLNWTPVTSLRQYPRKGVDVKIIKENFRTRKWNMHASGVIGYRPSLFKPWEFVFEYHYVPRHYRYEGLYRTDIQNFSVDNAEVTFEEQMKWDNFLLYTKYNFNIEKFNFWNRTSYYALLGGGISNLQGSRLEDLVITFRKNPELNSHLGGLIITPCFGEKSLRKRANYSLLVGGGGKYKVSSELFLFFEARYDILLNNIIEEENRYNCSILKDFLYVDSDRLVHNISISGGVILQLYFPKERKKTRQKYIDN